MGSYYLSGTNSDLAGGNDFSRALALSTGTAGSVSTSTGANATDDSYAWTALGSPGAGGTSTGTFTLRMNVTATHANLRFNMGVARVNAAGVVQAGPIMGTETATGTTGVKSFALTNPALGTWSSGDRLRVTYRVRNTSTGTRAATIETLTANTEITVPWSTTVQALAGTVGGIGSQTGTGRVLRPLDGTSGGVGSQSGDLAVASSTVALLAWAELEVPDVAGIAGATGGTGGQTGALRVAWRLSGATGGTGTATGDISIPPIAFLAWAEFEVPDAPTQQHALDGVTDGSGAQTGTLRVLRSLDGTSTGAGGQTGDIDIAWRLGGTTSAIGSQSGAEPEIVYRLSGTTSGSGGADGQLLEGGTIPLAGTLAATGDQTGDIDVAWRLGGTTGGIGGAHGVLAETGTAFVAGTTEGAGGQSGAVTVSRGLDGTTDGIGAQSGGIRILWRLGGTTGGSGAASGDLVIRWPLAGTTGGIGGARGDLSAAGPGVYDELTGTLAIERALTGILALERALIGLLYLEGTGDDMQTEYHIGETITLGIDDLTLLVGGAVTSGAVVVVEIVDPNGVSQSTATVTVPSAGDDWRTDLNAPLVPGSYIVKVNGTKNSKDVKFKQRITVNAY